MFFDEEMLLDLRLNILDRFVDKFVIVESQYAHNGEKRKLLFNINNLQRLIIGSKSSLSLVISKRLKSSEVIIVKGISAKMN